MFIELPGGGSEKGSLQHKHESWQYCKEKFQSRESLPQSRPDINKLEAVHNCLLHVACQRQGALEAGYIAARRPFVFLQNIFW